MSSPLYCVGRTEDIFGSGGFEAGRHKHPWPGDSPHIPSLQCAPSKLTPHCSALVIIWLFSSHCINFLYYSTPFPILIFKHMLQFLPFLSHCILFFNIAQPFPFELLTRPFIPSLQCARSKLTPYWSALVIIWSFSSHCIHLLYFSMYPFPFKSLTGPYIPSLQCAR